jgi:hypothetical protein
MDVDREARRASDTGLLRYQEWGDPGSSRWPKVDESARPVVAPPEVIIWETQTAFTCHAETQPGKFRRSVSHGGGQDPMQVWVVCTDQRVVCVGDQRAAFERKAPRSFAVTHVLVGQLRYEWVNRIWTTRPRHLLGLFWGSYRFGFDTSDGNRQLRLEFRDMPRPIPDATLTQLVAAAAARCGRPPPTATIEGRRQTFQLSDHNRIPSSRGRRPGDVEDRP